MSREYDLILHGATGFTGSLIAAYLYSNAPVELRWAMSGRNAEKLQRVQSELLKNAPDQKRRIPFIVADSLKTEDMRDLTAQSSVIISAVGPYVTFGMPLLQACIDNQTHCLDLTGENPFVRNAADAFHDDAKRLGLKIVNSCGFDSIPSDIGVWMMQQAALERFGEPLKRIEMAVVGLSGALSGGTLASMSNLLENRHDPVSRRAMGHPYGLNPKDGVKGLDGTDLRTVRWSPTHRAWTAPFMMAAINTRIVRRSHALLGWPWGSDFQYSEVSAYGSGFKGWRRAQFMTWALGSFVALMLIGPSRAFLKSVFLPKPGEGPTLKKRKKGKFRIKLIGSTADGRTLTGVVGAKMDPGYDGTALMISESALSLIFNRDDLPALTGVLTPSTAFGDVLLSRLRKAGMQFELED